MSCFSNIGAIVNAIFSIPSTKYLTELKTSNENNDFPIETCHVRFVFTEDGRDTRDNNCHCLFDAEFTRTCTSYIYKYITMSCEWLPRKKSSQNIQEFDHYANDYIIRVH